MTATATSSSRADEKAAVAVVAHALGFVVSSASVDGVVVENNMETDEDHLANLACIWAALIIGRDWHGREITDDDRAKIEAVAAEHLNNVADAVSASYTTALDIIEKHDAAIVALAVDITDAAMTNDDIEGDTLAELLAEVRYDG